MANHRYWRVLITASTSGATKAVQLFEVEMRDGVSGTDLCPVQSSDTGIVTASHNTTTSFQLFDNDTGTYWSNGAPSADSWFRFDFGSGTEVFPVELAINPRYASQSPADFTIQFSDNDADWTNVASWSGLTDWSVGVYRTFAIPQQYDESITEGFVFSDSDDYAKIFDDILSDIFKASDETRHGDGGPVYLTDGFMATDWMWWPRVFNDPLSESITTIESLTPAWALELQETVNLTEDLARARQSFSIIADTILSSEVLSSQFGKLVSESIQSSDSPFSVGTFAGAIIQEGIGISEVIARVSRINTLLSEIFKTSDSLLNPIFQEILRDIITSKDTLLSIGTFAGAIINEQLNVSEDPSIARSMMVSLAESLLVVEVISRLASLYITEKLNISESISNTGTLGGAVLEDLIRLYATPSTEIAILRAVAEQLLMVDSLNALNTWKVVERVIMGSSLSGGALQLATVKDAIQGQDSVRMAFEAMVQDISLMGDLSNAFNLAGVVVTEEMVLCGVSSSILHANVSMAMAFALADAGYRNFDAALVEDITLDDALLKQWLFGAKVLDGLRLSSMPKMNSRVRVLVSDGSTFSSNMSAYQVIKQSIVEGMKVFIGFREDDEEYTGFVMNTENFAVSTYDNFSFNAITVWNGSLYASNGAGIFRLEDSPDDAGETIAATIQTGLMDFGSPNMKRVTEAFVGIRADGTMILKTGTVDGIARSYTLRPSADDVAGVRAKLAKGVKSRYWQFTLENSAGSDFDLDTIEFFPVMLARRER